MTPELSARLDAWARDLKTPRHIQVLPQGVINFSGNDYLGLAADHALRHQFLSSVDERLSSTSSALLSGHSQAHADLSSTLETLYGRPALLFPSGWHANTGIVAALGAWLKGNLTILSDKLIHASVIDGMRMAELHGARFVRWAHNDLGHLENLLEKHAPTSEALLVCVESVYGMDGDTADLQALVALKKRYPNMLIMVDEAHGVGVLGDGLGFTAQLNLTNEIDFLLLTFGKAVASQGAALIADSRWQNLFINTARPLIYSTAESPLTARWTQFVFEHRHEWAPRRQILSKRVHALYEVLNQTCPDQWTPVVPVIIPGNEAVSAAAKQLLKQGFAVGAIRSPTVPKGKERLRISVSASISDPDFDQFLIALKALLS